MFDDKCCSHVKQLLDLLIHLNLTIESGDYAGSDATIVCPTCDLEFDPGFYWRKMSAEEAHRFYLASK